MIYKKKKTMKAVPEINVSMFNYVKRSVDDSIYFRAEMFKEYGDIFKKKIRGSATYYLSHPEYVKIVLDTEQNKYFNKHPLQIKTFAPFLGKKSISLSNDIEQWYKDRMIAKLSFDANTFFEDYANTIVKFCQESCKRWKKTLDFRNFPIEQEIDLLLLNIIMHTIFIDFGILNVKDFLDVIPITIDSVKSKLRNFMNPFWSFSPSYRQCLKAIQYVSKLTCYIVKQRIEQDKQWDDLIGNFLYEYRSLDKNVLINEVSQHVSTFLIMAYFTTVALIHWILVSLSLYPHVERELRKEIERVLGKKFPRYQDLVYMPYLSAVVQETLRRDSSSHAIMRQAVEDGEIDGYFIPKGSGIILCISNLHRHPNFWENPEGYDPNRFLNNPLGQDHPFAYIPFGAGKRKCVAAAFSTMEAKLIIVTLLQHFKFALPPHVLVKPVITTLVTNRPNVPYMSIERV